MTRKRGSWVKALPVEFSPPFDDSWVSVCVCVCRSVCVCRTDSSCLSFVSSVLLDSNKLGVLTVTENRLSSFRGDENVGSDPAGLLGSWWSAGDLVGSRDPRGLLVIRF